MVLATYQMAGYLILEKLLFFLNPPRQAPGAELRYHHGDCLSNFQVLQAYGPRDPSDGRLSDFRKTPVFLKSSVPRACPMP